MTGSARLDRRGNPPTGQRKSGKVLPVLLSCCLFLAIACGCLLAALVLVGKHFVYNSIAFSHRNDPEIKIKRALARLSNDTKPLHYNLTLLPNLESGEFQGKVNITIVVKSAKDNVTLHSKGLHIDAVELKFSEHTEQLTVQNIEENIADETLTVVPKGRLLPGTYYLYFKFSGNLLKKLTGLYKSQYKKKDTNETRAIATSKFEPTYARQAFPCFDEPNMKAKYTMHLLKPNDPSYHALSNMPVAREETLENGNVLVHFEPSVKMSTYLTCFIVSDFKYTEDVAVSVPFRVYATPEQIEKTNYAREVGIKVLEYYTKYFGIPYPLPKLDMVAIPDFVSGAMEHWGLVTYRETALLYSNKTHSSANKQRITTVVAHELAHSWFGNLVTMNWWNDLWLNEGFASYIQYKGADSVEPDWQLLDQFIILTLHPILSLDSTLGSHPIVQHVTTPDEITSIFDTVSYNKGGSILRMLENAVGEKNFQLSVTNYLKAHEFGNAVTQDLLNEIQKIVGKSINVTEFISSWTMQMGYPVVNVKTFGKDYVLTQKQFLKDPDNEGKAPPSPYHYMWTIPITYITSENSTPQQVWFNHGDQKVTIPKPANVKWIKFNHRQVGFYRVNYEQDDWQRLSKNIHELSNADKTHLLEESFSLAEAGQLSYHIALNLTTYLKDELNYIPWSVASSVFGHLKINLANSEYLSNFKKYVISLVSPAFTNLTWDTKPDDNHLRRRARVTVLDLACSMGHTQCLKDAAKQFTSFLYNKTELSQDLRQLIYSYGMSYGSEEDWNHLFNAFVAETDANEKLKLLDGLASIKDATILKKLINLAKDETYIRSQDYFSCLKYISDNPIGTSLVWDYVRENWELLVERFTLNDRYLGSLIPAITKSFNTATKLEEMQAFFIKYPNAGAGATARAQALETVQNNIKWLARHKESIEDWLKD